MQRLIALLVLIISAAACGDATPSAEGVERSVAPEPIAVPADEAVLTISGDVALPNTDGVVLADLDGIEALGMDTTTIFEPFVSENIEFSGVPLADLLVAAGIDDDASLVFVALNDYEVSFTMQELRDDSALLATRQAGEPIDLAEGGPTRVVFTDPESPLGRNLGLWIWSLAEIEVG